MTVRLGHINIKTPRFEETLLFYKTLFGLRRTPALTMAEKVRNAWLANQDGQPIIHVNTASDLAGAAPAHLDHVAFECNDVEDMRRRLDALDIAYVHQICPYTPIEQIFFRDPNDIRIELTFTR